MTLGNDNSTVQFAGEYLITPLAMSKFNSLNNTVEPVNCLYILVKSTCFNYNNSGLTNVLNSFDDDFNTYWSNIYFM